MGTVTSSSSSNRGGFIGYHSSGTLTNCGYNTDCGVTGAVNGSTNVVVTKSNILGNIYGAGNEKAAIENGCFTEVSTGEALLAALQAKQNVKLTANIDLSTVTWAGVSNYSGVLDGNGFTISGLNSFIIFLYSLIKTLAFQ